MPVLTMLELKYIQLLWPLLHCYWKCTKLMKHTKWFQILQLFFLGCTLSLLCLDCFKNEQCYENCFYSYLESLYMCCTILNLNTNVVFGLVKLEGKNGGIWRDRFSVVWIPILEGVGIWKRRYLNGLIPSILLVMKSSKVEDLEERRILTIKVGERLGYLW